jgi:hypothetical protein
LNFIILEKVAEGFAAELWRDLTEQSQKSYAARLVGRDNFAHRIYAIGTKEKEKCQYTYKGGKYHTGISTWKTPPSTAKSAACALVLGTAFRFILLK